MGNVWKIVQLLFGVGFWGSLLIACINIVIMRERPPLAIQVGAIFCALSFLLSYFCELLFADSESETENLPELFK